MGEGQARRITTLHSQRNLDFPESPAADVTTALERNGLAVQVLNVPRDLRELANRLQEKPPELVFNLVEPTSGHPTLPQDVAATLELLQFSYTGAGPAGLHMTSDPELSRRVLAARGVSVVAGSDDPEGTDISVGLLGNEVLEVFPSHEAGSELLPGHITPFVGAREEKDRIARIVFDALRFRDYGLLVLRLTPSGALWVVRAFPNPSLGRDGALARAAERAGWSYDSIILRVLEEGLGRTGVPSVLYPQLF
ncbi:MAG: hypothetical protein HY698_01390 [Deltaproteobacteria bacterium]|nr:hypothetical protein [Deltaproteobacteria bacterium]